jgi:sugar phosphate isomerase/epimerase
MAISIGLNWRMFKDIWRPAIDEIEFAASSGFDAIQFLDRGKGFSEAHLGESISEVSNVLKQSGLTSVMEINVIVGLDGKTKDGDSPIESLKRNLDIIEAFKCQCVHWHLACFDPIDVAILPNLEKSFIPDCEKAVEFSKQLGFRFGIEHNAREVPLLVDTDHCQVLLDAVPDLGFVWDLNHTDINQLSNFQALAPRMSMLHVSDTPLPETNYHLPLGHGNIDFAKYLKPLVDQGFDRPAILEIGGVPHHGGTGRDTDETLVESQQRLRSILASLD